MTVLIFFIILAILIVSHEFGHFIVAKKSGIRVDEFGLGFPPKLLSYQHGETKYTLNLIPFGGFVKIFGEDPDEASLTGPDAARSMVNKPKWIQAAVLAAGVTFNVILAWLLISLGFMIGLPTPADQIVASDKASAAHLLITDVVPDSPAAKAGLKPGDELVDFKTPAAVQDYIGKHATEDVTIHYRRGKVFSQTDVPVQTAILKPVSGLVDGRLAIGIGMENIALVRKSFFAALGQGFLLTVHLVWLTATAIVSFIANAFTGQASLGGVTGPVGLISLVGDATTLGFIYLLNFTAFISINLAVINLIPFPALDGGRLLFLLIEKVKGSAINPKVANTLNTVGFALLLLLMAIVTYHDIAKMF